MGAAVSLVSERGTANVPVSDIADAAGVSRQLVYLHFGDRDRLLLEAALDLARGDLAGLGEATAEAGRERALAVARHFAEHRDFYRAVFSSASAFAFTKAVSRVLTPLPRASIEARYGEALPGRLAEDFALFVASGTTALVSAWVAEDGEALDPEVLADRLLAVGRVATAAVGELVRSGPDCG
ncbi:TetR family transcriptional regulator [Glycomyces paridis]|uniref:TetR family transcriptional regulator n=2 Tax=Glycomyces paridis TaxID=2126555 RepID=A0A4S8PDU0_9ACTN|nr:TetR family transcriptional regulator [Glycomyces paridis]